MGVSEVPVCCWPLIYGRRGRIREIAYLELFDGWCAPLRGNSRKFCGRAFPLWVVFLIAIGPSPHGGEIACFYPFMTSVHLFPEICTLEWTQVSHRCDTTG